MLEDAIRLRTKTEARDALSALQEYVADGVENGIASRPLDAAQMDRIWHCWRTVMQTVAEAAASQRGLEPSAFIVDISEEATCACPDSSQSSGPQEQRNTSQSKSKAVHEDKEAAAFRAQTLALAHRVTSAEGSIDLPTIVTTPLCWPGERKWRSSSCAVPAKGGCRKCAAGACCGERKRNHRLNISAAKEKQETLKREVARQREGREGRFHSPKPAWRRRLKQTMTTKHSTVPQRLMVRYNIYTRTLPFYLSPVSAVLLSLSMYTTHTDQHASKGGVSSCSAAFGVSMTGAKSQLKSYAKSIAVYV